jgi:hypothetical protein
VKAKLTQDQKRMRDAVRRLRKYMNCYPKEGEYMNYKDYTFIEDVLYGLGIALEPEAHAFAVGFERFKDRLRKHLTVK